VSAGNLVAAVAHLPEAERARLQDPAAGAVHLATAIRALDRGDHATVKAQLERACRLMPISSLPITVEHRLRLHLRRAHDPQERLRALTAMAELWPDQQSDTARVLRTLAIAAALLAVRPRQAARLIGRWPRGGSRRFFLRHARLFYQLARNFLEDRRRWRKVAELGGSPQPLSTVDPPSLEAVSEP
jgi:hypothetical protein